MKIKNVCYSGASEGADLIFANFAKIFGHEVMNFSFQNHIGSKEQNTIKLTILELFEGDKQVKAANVYLKRKYPSPLEYVNNLVRRNYFQIKYSDRIYAIGNLEENTKFVSGGTGFTVMMGVLNNIKEIYLYCQNNKRWYKFNNFDRTEGRYYFNWDEIDINSIPNPCGKYTGIGSVDITDDGKEQIKFLYELRNIV